MTAFKEAVIIAGRDVDLAVERGMGRTRVVANGSVVLDQKPFISKVEFGFAVDGSALSVRFEPLGFGEECFVLVAGTTTRLATCDQAGAPLPEPTKTGRERIVARMAAIAALGAIPICLIQGWPAESGWYKPVYLQAPPGVLVVGLLCLAYSSLSDEKAKALVLRLGRTPKWMAYPAILGFVACLFVVGRLFQEFILKIAAKAP